MSVEEYEDDYEGGGATRWVIAAVVAIVLIGGAFFAGRAMAGSGPATLAEAVQQARAGDLPCGDTGTTAAAATPPADANGAPPAGGFGGANGTQFALRAICGQNSQTGNGAPGTGTNGGGAASAPAEPAGSASASPARSPASPAPPSRFRAPAATRP